MADQPSFNYDVFHSYSSKDKAVVRALAKRLEADGLQVWFDEWALKPGDNILANIEEGLEQSRVLLLCMSANAFGSDSSRLNLHTALTQRRIRLNACHWIFKLFRRRVVCADQIKGIGNDQQWTARKS